MTKPRIFSGWAVVASSGVGITFGPVIFVSGAFAQLANAWGREFGWDQSQLARAATIFLLLQMLSYPFVGALIDRHGSRKIALGSIALFALSLIALSQISGSLLQLYGAFALIGLIAPVPMSFPTRAQSRSGSTAARHRARPRRGGAGRRRGSHPAVDREDRRRLRMERRRSRRGRHRNHSVPAARRMAREGQPGTVRPAAGRRRRPDAVAADGALLTGMSRAEIIRSASFWKLAASFAVMGLTI